jgi:hypothetical protein
MTNSAGQQDSAIRGTVASAAVRTEKVCLVIYRGGCPAQNGNDNRTEKGTANIPNVVSIQWWLCDLGSTEWMEVVVAVRSGI